LFLWLPPPTVRGAQMMIPSEKKPPSKSAWPPWLTFCLLGLAATACGLVVPHSLRSLREPTAAIPPPAPAQGKKDALEYNPPELPEISPTGPMLLRLVLGTIFVLILCSATLWAGKRWIRPLTVPAVGNRKLRVLESLPLGGRCSLFLLQAEKAKILVGVDQAGIKALLPLPQSFDGALAEVIDEVVSDAS
jgi:flagellar biogenesis protein FliO